MAKYNDFIIDLETLGNKPDCIVVDVSILIFDPDPKVMQPLDELIKNGKRFKLNLESQKGVRSTTPSTVKWWMEQSPEAKKNLLPSSDDVTVEEAVTQILAFLKENGINQWKSQGWCRGMSFDFPIFVDMIRQTFKTNDTDKLEPIKFHCQRDIRTAIEAYSLVRGMTKTPLRKGILDGFVHHDSIHDCAKDVIMLKMAQRYALQLEEIPAPEDTDPFTV
ncbi:exonuclease A [Acinetobacter phage vB_ApiM_fHyAci03]|uniref:Exonuclease A n=1 Tax=Acinetobacter phage vB_ApiM_fHyAci03 TaxID=2269366 RepID=A0A345AUK5_9CAUD|nr:exonuclease A [Acinetobacter phage vB_ApiM_fHyAci03]AXF40588.1 exonuclease A [Acinetobacter phage vB_ApiM_fHyAci03]